MCGGVRRGTELRRHSAVRLRYHAGPLARRHGQFRSSSEALRYLNGIAAKRIIDHLKHTGRNASLLKLREETKRRNYKHSVWGHHPNVFEIYGEETLMQKVGYIHQNPVRAGLARRAEDYLYSSARIWNRVPIGDEPLLVDAGRIDWRPEA
jgi:hypothetical protein